MPAKSKRLQVTLTPEVWRLVDEIHELTGAAKSGIISEMLSEVAPVFMNQIQALRVLKESPQEAARLVQNFSNESISKLAQANLELDAVIDGRTVKGRAKRGGIRAAITR